MYIDLSVLPTNKIEFNYLVKKLPQQNYGEIAVDYEFIDSPITKPKQELQIDNEKIKVHTRATLVIQQNATLHQLSQQRNQYLLIAIKPLNQRIFQAICTEYDNYDIITLDYGNKMPFMLKRNPVYEALRKGKYFEIQYETMFDQNKRVTCMTNIVNLIKATNGKNIIVSSRSQDYTKHRSPYDICSLLISLGMKKDEAFDAISTNPQIVIKSAYHRKFFKGSIQQISMNTVEKMSKKIAKHRANFKKKWQQIKDNSSL